MAKRTTKTTGKNAGYSKVKGGIKSKKTGKVYKGKNASVKARKRRSMFGHINKSK